MESFNLKTASTYINNLLLARGLLRDGKPIEFAHPSRGEGGKEVTMAQIINLVHDLILKRDRDQEHRESLASTLRTLRNDATRQTTALEKLQTRNEDLSRQLSLAQSQERSARAALRTAESSARSLREEMLRLKTTVQQVRTSCANDIRKRDVQIQRLKTHLTGQQRGNRTGLVGASITITPGSTSTSGRVSREEASDLDDPSYSLRQETTEFLTQLSQSLSDENDSLIGLVRSTLVTLKELQGLPQGPRQGEDGDLTTIGEEEEEHEGQQMMHGVPTSYETLAADMDTVLENLKTLLTNPNFVSVEEVEMREEEIAKLRAGWDRMETRWRDTLALMDGWRKRIASGDNTINLDDLTRGMELSAGLEAATTTEVSTIMEEDEDGVSSVMDEEVDEQEELEEPPTPETVDLPDKTTASDMFSLKLQRDQPALREGSGNKSPIKSPRKVAFSASIPNTPASEVGNENAQEGTPQLEANSISKRSRLQSKLKTTPLSEERTSRPTSQDSRVPHQKVRCDKIADQLAKLASKVTISSSPSPSSSSSSPSVIDFTTALYIDEQLQTKKRLSSPHAHPEERSPKISVEDKLKAAQAEAEAAAAVAEKTKLASPEKAKKGKSVEAEGEGSERAQRPRGSPIKTRISGRPKRRKSTLTPEELQNLLGFE